MFISFKKVHIENFLSIGEATLELQNAGFVFVQGINNYASDNAKSNGSGKSAIWDAIIWCITGTTTRGISKDVNNIITNDVCRVSVLFTIDTTEYEIIRFKSANSPVGLKLFVDGKDVSGKGVRDTEKLIQQYMPDVTNDLISSVVILGQGLPNKFSSNTPSGRKEVLETLSASDYMIEDIKERITKRKTDIGVKLRKIQDTLLVSNNSKSYLQTQLNNIVEKIKEHEASPPSYVQLEQYKQELNSLNTTLCEYQAALRKLEEANVELEDKLSKYTEDYNNLVNSIKEKNKENTTKYYEVYYASKNRCDYLSREIDKIKNIQEVCPTCGQKLPDVFKPDCTDLIKELEAVRAERDECNRLIEEENRKTDETLQETSTQFKNNFQVYDKEFQSNKIHIKDITSKIQAITQDISGLNIKIERLKLELEQYSNVVSDLKNQRDNTIREIDTLNETILYNTTEESITQQSMDIVSKMYSIVTRDFRGYLLHNVIEFIENRLKKYSLQIFNTDNIKFMLNGNNIDIVYEDKLYENLSGGEKQRIDIMIQFALREMLCQFRNFSCNILVLDELLDALDKVSSDAIVEFINNNVRDVDSVFFITHHTDLNLPFDDTITICKNTEGVSYLT